MTSTCRATAFRRWYARWSGSQERSSRRGVTAIRDGAPIDRGPSWRWTLAAYEQYAAALTPPLWARYRQNIQATLSDVGTAAQIVAEEEGGAARTAPCWLFPAGRYAESRGTAIPLEWPEVRLLAVRPGRRREGSGAPAHGGVHPAGARGRAPALTLHTADLMAVAMRSTSAWLHAAPNWTSGPRRGSAKAIAALTLPSPEK